MPSPKGPISHAQRPVSPPPLKTGEERIHNTQDDYGQAVPPQRVLCGYTGWLYDPRFQPQYTGANKPWRQT